MFDFLRNLFCSKKEKTPLENKEDLILDKLYSANYEWNKSDYQGIEFYLKLVHEGHYDYYFGLSYYIKSIDCCCYTYIYELHIKDNINNEECIITRYGQNKNKIKDLIDKCNKEFEDAKAKQNESFCDDVLKYL